MIENVRANEDYFEDQLRGLMARHEIIGDVRGAGYFMSIELVKDRATKETFDQGECEVLLRDFLSPELLQGRPDLSSGRSRRPRHPALAAAHLHP